ncbi:MAG: zinc-dependent alcohol dehydrogenase family protein [Candidatus Abyssubacteria bacterium]
MRAMVLESPRPVRERPLVDTELPDPVPGPGEIRIRVNACGVCHTDLHTVEGDLALPRLPVVPGHQIVGMVERTGPGVTRFTVGDRVGVPWLYSTCGQCDYCRRGLENLCDEARFTGLHADGGYAEYVISPAEFSYRLPFGFADLQAAPLLCAGIIGYRSFKLSEVAPGQRLGLYGFGASAHVTIQIARYWECEVYVFTRSKEHRDHALEMGAAWAGRAEDTPPSDLHSAIIFAPAGGLVLEALRVLRKGGTLALAGIHMTPIPQMDYSRIYGERTVRSVANCTRDDAEELLRLASEIPIRTDIETYQLSEANQVLERLKQAEVRGAAVLKVAQPE